MTDAAVWAVPATLTDTEVCAFVDEAVRRLDAVPSTPAGGADRSLSIDLSPLQHFDSSAIAAMVAIERRASERKVGLRFLNATSNLRKLAALYAVDDLLFGV